MEKPIFENNIVEEHCNPGVAPVIIKEIYFPPKSSEEVATLVESALVYQNSGNYEQALESFEQAWDLWRQENGGKDLRSEVQMYFLLSIGSVCESAGRDEMALRNYLDG